MMILNPEKVWRYIIRKDGEYLMSKPYEDSWFVRYSRSPYEAARFKDFDQALRAAKIVGGKVYKLNMLTGEMLGGWK